MKKSLFLFVILCLFNVGLQAQQNKKSTMTDYKSLWKQVEQFEEKDLPKSARQTAEDILQKAIKEKDTQQCIKALFHKGKYDIVIDSENNIQIFSDLNKLLQETQNSADKALLHSILGELYIKYYNNNPWEFKSRTNLSDYIPEDMKEWSQNIIFNKAIEHFNAAIADKNILLNTTTQSYKEIIEFGKDSKEYYPTLFDFIIERNIDNIRNLPNTDLRTSLLKDKALLKDINADSNAFLKVNLGSNETYNKYSTLIYYQQFLSSLTERGLTATVILTELSKIDYLNGQLYYIYRENYQKEVLLNLYEKYKNKPESVEIIDRIVKYYNYKSSDEEKEQAYSWCKKGIEQYPLYKRIAILKQSLASLESPSAAIFCNSIFHPETKEKKLILTYNNLNKVDIIIKKQDSNGKYVSFKTINLDLTPKTSYINEEKEINLDLNEIGNYEITASFDRKTANKPETIAVSITKIAIFGKALTNNDYEFYIVDRNTGTPIKDVNISILKKDTVVSTIKSDSKGFATYNCTDNLEDYSIRSSYRYKVSLANDKPDVDYNLPYSYAGYFGISSTDNSDADETIRIFTDRSIYRPGQTVYFKAVVAEADYKKATLLINEKYTVSLYDSNSQLISEQELTTNEFGSIAGQFILPQRGNIGEYYIEIGDTEEYFSVEEYKRPTFNVTFDNLKGTYTFGDKVTVIGHAQNFSGIKIQGANVDYTISKRSLWRFGNESTLETDNVTTKDDGSFDISFTIPIDDNNTIPYWRNISSYTIEASVTDLNGETRSGEYSFSVGSVSMILSTNISDKEDKNSDKIFTINASNLNGEKISTDGTYTLHKIIANDTTEVLKGNFKDGVQELLNKSIKQQASGKYLLKLKAKDSNNKDVESETEFVLYSLSDKRPAIETNEWIINKNNKFSENKPAEIIVGVSAKDATILYEILKGNKRFEQQQIKLSNENKTISIPYKKEYEDKVDLVLTYMIKEKVYQRTISLEKEKTLTTLNLKLDVFRDKLRPGQHEEWRISVKDNQNNPVIAELLASMYDVSLDEIRQTKSWSLENLLKSDYSPSNSFRLGNSYGNRTYSNFYFRTPKIDYPVFVFDKLNWFGFYFNSSRIMIRGAAKITQESATPVDAMMGMAGELEGKMAGISVASTVYSNTIEEKNNVKQDAPIRKNFNETAFFYPQLRTNENGETLIAFTVPESNTTWKFRLLTHDKSLASGTLEQEVVTRKELMVTPNIPRFMRQGDKTSISTKISNLSDANITGNVRIEFFDPLTDKVVDWKIANQEQAFSIAKDASSSAEWLFDIPTDIDMIGCRIIADSKSFSDGEQHVISVLPNRMLVTESLPLNVNGIQTKNFKFDKLANNQSSSLSNYRFTLEYSSNPAWYAVQALPQLSNPNNENAINWFASYYVNTLGSHIVKQYPKVSAMISAWKKQGETKESISSKLTQNEELKSVLLEETPWVLDAKDETEQMQRLSLLFDLNSTNQSIAIATQKLSELQNSDGGWSWYKGFASSRSITQYILYGYTQLIHLNAVEYPSEIKQSQMSALKYIDAQILKDFNDLKKYNKKWSEITQISTNQLEYLYVRSAYRDIPIDKDTREAERFYNSVVEKNWSKLSLYERSLLTVLAKRNGNKTLSNAIIKSLRERATVNEEIGMFWANNKSNVFLSLTGISTHTFLMDAFNEMGADSKEMNLMKQWLVKQKQTQLWESTHASIDAIYTLLSTGSDWFGGSGDVKIKIANKVIETSKQEAGTGYLKQSWDSKEITKNMGNIEVTNNKDIPSYGAIYWQYFENLDKITAQKGDLNIDKKLFVEKSTNTGKELAQVSESNPLQIGDKVIVRLTVRTDRDMEFVHLKDMRASCFEPVETLSGVKWDANTIYYQSIKDASTNFYFDHLAKGTYVFEYPVYVTRKGEYANGISSIQCMYAPEFISNTQGISVTVK